MAKSLDDLKKQRQTLVDALKKEHNKKNDFLIGFGLTLFASFLVLAFVSTGAFLLPAALSCFIWGPKVHKRRKLQTSINIFDQHFKRVEEEKKKDEAKKKEGEKEEKKEETKEGEKKEEKKEEPVFKRTPNGLLIDQNGKYYTKDRKPVEEFKITKFSEEDFKNVDKITVEPVKEAEEEPEK